MLQITIFLLALAFIYVVKCVVVMRSSQELAANASAISLVRAQDAYTESVQAQKRDAKQVRAAADRHYVAYGMRRRVA